MFRGWTILIVCMLAATGVSTAAPILVPPVPETLVEGHTVFAIIEASNKSAMNKATYATSVAILVREIEQRDASLRFPGVLWFNDQYLVEPESADASASRIRYPCGGAVMVVNRGESDPRMDGVRTMNGANNGSAAMLTVSNMSGRPSVDADGVSITTSANQFSYEKSYRIMDPNDHLWTIDKYVRYLRVGSGVAQAQGGFPTSQLRTSPVWVVNTLGSEVFIADDGEADCGPYDDEMSLPVAAALKAYRDDPKYGYNEPSRNNYCYNGQPPPCAASGSTQPERLYNALIYIDLKDLIMAGEAYDHSDPANSTDTNGCQDGTEWACNGAKEGNSHAFHPTNAGRPAGNLNHAVVPGHASDCNPETFDTPPSNPANHGGSTQGAPRPDGTWVDEGCDYLHASRMVDVWFSAKGRPYPPLFRTYAIDEIAGPGSNSRFANYHCAYEGAGCNPTPATD